MNCLIDYIGIETCTTENTPESGDYINSLEGMELKQIQAIADDDQQTYLQVWADVQNRAAAKFRADLISEFSKRYKLRQLKELMNFGRIIDENDTIAPSANYVGHTIELNQNVNDQVVNSNYSAIWVGRVSFYAIAPSDNRTIPFRIFDLDSGNLLYSSTFSTTSIGWITKEVNQTFNVRRVMVCVNAANITTVAQNIGSNLTLNWFCCGKAMVKGASAPNTSNPESYTQGTNTYGLSTTFAIVCQWDNLVCQFKEHFKMAWKYLLGIELMNERIFTSRINRWTTTDLNRAKELMNHYNIMYRGGQNQITGETSEGYLYLAVDGIQLDCSDSCFECNDIINFRTSRL